MKSINALILSFSLAISSLAFAEGGGDRTSERVERALEAALDIRKPDSPVGIQEDIAQQKLMPEKQKHHC